MSKHRVLLSSLFLSALAVAAGCNQQLVIGGGSGGFAGGAGSGEDGTSSSPCPSGRGPAMVRIPAPGTKSYCIDQTEVTQAQYDEFLASGPTPDTTSAFCGYKKTFAPGEEPGDITQILGDPTQCHPFNTHFDPANTPDHPVVCVDWCDAEAYCAWAGKRLCGRIGGGPASGADYNNADTDEWYRACSGDDASQFPYGSSFQQGACSDGTEVSAVASSPDCHGQDDPFDQIFDMSGNVAEWENDCTSTYVDPGPPGWPQLPACFIRGGSAGQPPDGSSPQVFFEQKLACSPATGGLAGDSLHSERPYTGIRCCAD